MSKKLTVVAIVAVLTAGVAPTAAGAATKNEVTIETYVNGPPIEDFFTGYVTSKEKDCKNKREVTLYHKVDGADEAIGTDKTTKVDGERSQRAARYGWSVPLENAPAGKYYAKISKEKGCAADKSKDYVRELEGRSAAERKAAARTKVEIGGYGFNGAGNGGQFQVEVISNKLKCKKGRKVTMYRDEPGGPVKIGSSKAISGEGTWVAIIEDEDDPTEDAYYAVAPAEPGCKKDTSKDYFPFN